MSKHRHQFGDTDVRLVGQDPTGLSWNYMQVSEDGYIRNQNMIWNTSTLAWEAATGSLASGSSVQVSNFPATQAVTNAYDDVTRPYKFSDMDTAASTMYFGSCNADGGWMIMEFDSTAGTMRYAKGTSGYSTAWTDRALQSYGYFSAAF